MKRLLLTLIAVSTMLSFSGCGRDEKTAIEEFKKDVTATKTWMDAKKASADVDPIAGVKEMATKLKAIKTDGLPADLKDPWNTLVGGVDKMVALMGSMPKDPAEMAKNPDGMKDFMTKMSAIEAEVKPATEKLAAAGKKYGIDGIEGFGPK